MTPSSSSSPALVRFIKRIYSTIRITKKIKPPEENPKPPKDNQKQPIEIKQHWPYKGNGEILPYFDYWPVKEHCIGLCKSSKYRFGWEKALYLDFSFSPLDWKTIRLAMLSMGEPSRTPDQANITMFRALQHTEVKIGEGRKTLKTGIEDGHVMMRISAILPVDENLVVHGSWQKPSSYQSRCWHVSSELELDCDQLIHRMRKPMTYTRIDCPGGYYVTGSRRCKLCPSVYIGSISRTESEGVDRELGKPYPYAIRLSRWIDLGELRQEEEPEEFRALTAGQACCDHLKRVMELPINRPWQGRDWSTIPSLIARVDDFDLR